MYPSAERAAAAVALAAQRARWLANVAEEDAEAPETPTDAAELAVARRIVRGGATTDGWLEPDPSVRGHRIRWHPGRAVAVRPIARGVRRRGGGVSAPHASSKATSSGVLHKSDEGAVVLDIADDEAASDDVPRPGRPLRRPTPRRPRPGPGHTRARVARRRRPASRIRPSGPRRRRRHRSRTAQRSRGARRSGEQRRRRLGRSTDSGWRRSSTATGAAPPLPVDRVADLVHRVSLLAIAVPELDAARPQPGHRRPGRMRRRRRSCRCRRRRRPGQAAARDARSRRQPRSCHEAEHRDARRTASPAPRTRHLGARPLRHADSGAAPPSAPPPARDTRRPAMFVR